MALGIERCDDLATAGEIKDLFLRNERPAFPEAFDLVYPGARAAGGSSWIARDESGVVVGHVAVFPRVFRGGDRVMQAVVFGDLMMAKAHRNFFAAAQLCRAAVADLRAADRWDFAYAYSMDLAAGVLRAGGLRPVGAMRRFVQPVNALYRFVARLGAGAEALDLERFERPWEERVSRALAAIPPGPLYRSDRSPELYGPRLGRELLEQWEWFVLRRPADPIGAPVALALGSRGNDPETLAIQDIRWDEGRVAPSSVIHALAGAAQASGCRKLSINAAAPSSFARTLAWCGFLMRADALALLQLPLRAVDLPPPEQFLLTPLEGTAW